MVKIYTVAAPDEWKIRTALERELYQFKFELVPRNYLPNQTYADQLVEKLALADVILVIFTKELKEREDFVYSGETDHVIPWQSDQGFNWRTEVVNAVEVLSKVVV